MIFTIPPIRVVALAWLDSRISLAMRAKRWADAAALCGRAAALAPFSAGHWVRYGAALTEAGDLPAAETAYRTAVRLAPHAADARRHLALLLKRVGRLDAATAAFIDALALSPAADDLKAEVLSAGVSEDDLNLRLTVAALAIGEPQPPPRRPLRRWVGGFRLSRAIEAADRAAAARDWPKAAMRYRAAITLDPHRAAIHVQLGHALKEQGDLRGAVVAYRSALASAPHDPDPHLHLGHVYKLLNHKASSITAYANAWRLQPGYGDVERELQDFAGWSAETIRGFGIDSWSVSGVDGDAASTRREALRRWSPPPGLDQRERQVWHDLTLALDR